MAKCTPGWAPSRHSGQECDFFGHMVHYDPRGAWIVHMVVWDDCRATGGVSCRDTGQLQWPSSSRRACCPAGARAVCGWCG